MRILVTGATGFVGQHLLRELLESSPDAELHGTSRKPVDDGSAVRFHGLDLREETAAEQLIRDVQPDQIYHLAAQAEIRASFESPWDTFETNIRSQINLYQACLRHGLKPRVLIVSSGEVYANASPTDRPTTEQIAPQPTSPYAASKLAQEALAIQYVHSRSIPTIIARLFNQLGPGQREGFVAPDFAVQIARIEAGLQPPVVRVGSLDAQRDFIDVRDAVRALRLLMNAGASGELYNVASATHHRIGDVLDILCEESRVHITVEQDPARMRPASVPLLWGDYTKLQRLTGWHPTIPIRQSLRDVLDEYRQRMLAS